MAIELKTYNEFLGQLIRRIVADTALNDINTGSVLFSILEAIAQNDFENNAAILNVLELMNIDAIRDTDLEARAGDFSLTRQQAIKATGFITIEDTTISKRTANLYAIKPAPIAGSTVIYVSDAATWNPTGSLYIGRGTNSFEGPINYSSIVNYGTFFAINLSSALNNDHLLSDTVTDAQGTINRLIPAGTSIKIPANNQSPDIEFFTLRDAVIAAGEDAVSNVPIVAARAGNSSNAGINTITQFSALPFAGAIAYNTQPLTNGKDIETDALLRNRIKIYANTLARGTSSAITGAIIGVSDATEDKQVVSAVVTEPLESGEPSIIYLDDGTGFQPTYSGQSLDILLNNANGREEFLQLANYPLPRPQIVSLSSGPFQLTEGSSLKIAIDSSEEEVVFTASQFQNMTSATLAEVAAAINNQSTIFKCRLADLTSALLIYPIDFKASIIKVVAGTVSGFDANDQFKFPTQEFSDIKLYRNNILLNKKEESASLKTSPYSSWNITSSGSLIIEVDGTPPQARGFALTDFGISAFELITVEQWAEQITAKFAGITATVPVSGDLVILTSNKGGVNSSIKVTGGTYLNKMFGNIATSAVGKNSDFQLNRQNGNIRILTGINEGDLISAGSADTKGRVISNQSLLGQFNLDVDNNSRPAEAVIIADAKNVRIRGLVTSTATSITITDQGSDVMRIMSGDAFTFTSIRSGDYIYIANRGDNDGSGGGTWLDIKSCGLYRVIAKGGHISPNIDTYVEVSNVDIVPGSYNVQANEDLQAFYADAMPQLWRGSFVAIPAAATVQDVVDSLNNNIVNVIASTYKTSYVKLTSSTETNGSIAVPVVVGNAGLVFNITGLQNGITSHVANVANEQEVVSFFKRSNPSSANIWLNRSVYGHLNGVITASAAPGDPGVDPYGEILTSASLLNSSNVRYDDYVSILSGANKRQFKSIKEILVGDSIGTQHDIARTLFDYANGNRLDLFKMIELGSQDNLVAIIDNDPVVKTVDIPLNRTGRVNSGSQAVSYLPISSSFSAIDEDNEPGIDFGSLPVWGKTQTNTEFMDYAVWFRARNWYSTGGEGSGGGQFLIRAQEYGPNGEKLTFNIEYPSLPNKSLFISHINDAIGTVSTLLLGSSAEKAIGITPGTTFRVLSLGSYLFRLDFSTNPSVDFSSVLVNDVISIGTLSGVSTQNTGTYRVAAVNAINKTIDIYNPSAVPTFIGSAEITDVTTTSDYAGLPEITDIITVGDVGGSLDAKYFILNDQSGSVAFWYDIDNNGTSEPLHGASRSVAITTIFSGEGANIVATKTATAVNADSQFNATVLANTITVTDAFPGARVDAVAGTSGFSTNVVQQGVNAASIDGKYFILQDKDGSVAFWYDVDNNGTSEPPHGAIRSVKIDTVISNDSANTVASKTAIKINADLQFNATSLANIVTVTDATDGARSAPLAGTSGFSVVTNTAGVDDGYETIISSSLVKLFALIQNSVSEIVQKINNSSPLFYGTVVGDGTKLINRATRDEVYVPVSPTNWSASLSYGHNPDPLSLLNDYVSLYDGETWIKKFENLNPNFTLKKLLVLTGAAPTVYKMDTAPNHDSAALGELFKLIPRSIDNVQHHLTHKALSQLSIIAEVDEAKEAKSIQFKSKILGSSGVVEIVGGKGNDVEYNIIGDSQVINSGGQDYLAMKVNSAPVSLNIGDTVELTSATGSSRLSRLTIQDTIDVRKATSTQSDYLFNAKPTNFEYMIKFSISDVSASYSRSLGKVWRWQFSDSGSYAVISDKVNGLASILPVDQIAAGGIDAAELETIIETAGSPASPLKFKLTIGNSPIQASYYTFQNFSGDTFAVWFSVNGNLIAPTGATYISSTYKIKVDILSTDSDNTVVSKLYNALIFDAQFTTDFDISLTTGTNLQGVSEGDMLNAWGTLSGWADTNKSSLAGANKVSGHPIIAVNSGSRWIDVVNPIGKAMALTKIGSASSVSINPSPILKWNLAHSVKNALSTISVLSGIATASCKSPHRMNVGDTFNLYDSSVVPTIPGAGIGTVTAVLSPLAFTFATSSLDATYSVGGVLKVGRAQSRYRIEKLNFKNLIKLVCSAGDSPKFIECGAAVDDIVIISGDTFATLNAGEYRIRGLEDDYLLMQNADAIEQEDHIFDFNNSSKLANWTANDATVSGVTGTFSSLSLGDWVKKQEDDDTKYLQVITFDTGISSTATVITLGAAYSGSTSISYGVAINEVSSIDAGIDLLNVEDIAIYEGDAVRINDNLIVADLTSSNWFNNSNTGTFVIAALGTDPVSYRPYVSVTNKSAVQEYNRAMAIDINGLFISEGPNNIFSTYREIDHIAIDDVNTSRRMLYMRPADRSYKFAQSNKTKIVAVGKMNYAKATTVGIDGYLYYTGLLRTVQRVVDGFEPDADTYPGRKAVGGLVELLPPLINQLSLSLDITTSNGINLNEITNELKTAVINYVDGLGVGEDVILSEIIAQIMAVNGVAAATFLTPTPNTERIVISDNEKALIDASGISIS